jgi:hypothetical protein
MHFLSDIAFLFSNRALHTTPLHASALKGHVDVVRILLASKANVNAVTAEGRTVVHILAQKWAEHSGDDRFRTCLEMCLAQNGVEIDKKGRNLTKLDANLGYFRFGFHLRTGCQHLHERGT